MYETKDTQTSFRPLVAYNDSTELKRLLYGKFLINLKTEKKKTFMDLKEIQ